MKCPINYCEQDQQDLKEHLSELQSNSCALWFGIYQDQIKLKAFKKIEDIQMKMYADLIKFKRDVLEGKEIEQDYCCRK
jgi:hypothetical protein